MSDMVCTVIDLINNHRHVGYIRFNTDGNKEFDYRGRVSFDAFSNSYRNRCYQKIGRKKIALYHCKWYDDWRVSRDNTIKTFTRLSGGSVKQHNHLYKLPFVRVRSVWEFYNFIGYDYKSKKFTTFALPDFKKQTTYLMENEP